MHYDQLPTDSMVVGGIAADLGRLATWLEIAKYSRGEYFYAAEPIEKAPLSGRVFYTSKLAHHRFLLPSPLSSLELARELLRFSPEARYPTPAPSQSGWEKGWEIRKGMGPRGFIVIALAKWAQPQPPPR